MSAPESSLAVTATELAECEAVIERGLAAKRPASELERLEMRIAAARRCRPSLSTEEVRHLSDEARALYSTLPALPPRRGTQTRDTPTDIYCLYGAESELLYVGLSMTTAQRLGQHRAQPWWSEVARVEVEHLPSRDAASQRERDLIADLCPKYNRNGGGA